MGYPNYYDEERHKNKHKGEKPLKPLITIYSALLLLSTAIPIPALADTVTNQNEETVETTKETASNESVESTSSSQRSETTETTDHSKSTEATTDSQKASTSSTTSKDTTTSTEQTDSTRKQPVAPPVSQKTPRNSFTQMDGQTTSASQPEKQVPRGSVSSTPETIHFERVKTTEEFIQQIGESARKVAQTNDLFASVMIAQAILESGSGSSELSREPNYNLFGIKGDFDGQSVSFLTAEDNGAGQCYSIQSNFRKYPSYKESFEDYAKLLKDGVSWNTAIYTGTHKSVAKTYENATQALTGTYATDIQYNQKLNGLIETYHLTEFDQEKPMASSDSEFPHYNGVNYDTGNCYAWGNCTQYVYNRITQLGKHIDLTMGNGNEWGKTGRARGYEVTNIPKVGTAVSFPAGVLGADPFYGHVAFLEKINADGSLLISEMNVKGLNVVSTRVIPAEATPLLTYITPK